MAAGQEAVGRGRPAALRVLLQAVTDPPSGLKPGSIRCPGNQIQQEMSRNTQTRGNGHPGCRRLPAERHLGTREPEHPSPQG